MYWQRNEPGHQQPWSLLRVCWTGAVLRVICCPKCHTLDCLFCLKCSLLLYTKRLRWHQKQISSLWSEENGWDIADIFKCIFLKETFCINIFSWKNKADLRDLIAATGQVISNWIQIVNFSTRVTVKFDGWPRKTIGHFFYTTSSFVHHFKSIGEFELDLQSRNAQFGSKLVICYPVWPWNLMDDLGKQ